MSWYCSFKGHENAAGLTVQDLARNPRQQFKCRRCDYKVMVGVPMHAPPGPGLAKALMKLRLENEKARLAREAYLAEDEIPL